MNKSFRDTLCVVAIVVSVVSLIVSVFRNFTYDVDYPSLLVSALSVLVTALIGWNIYTVIDLRKAKAELAAISLGVSKQLHGDVASIESTLWMIYHFLYLKNDPLGLPFRYIHNGLLCLYNSSEFGDLKPCNLIVDTLVQSLTYPQNIRILQSSKQQLLLTLSKVRDTDKIPNFPSLVEKIALISTK